MFQVVVSSCESEVNYLTSPKCRQVGNSRSLPPLVTTTRNRKDELYKSVIQQLSENELGWHNHLKGEGAL